MVGLSLYIHEQLFSAALGTGEGDARETMPFGSLGCP